MSGIFNLCRAAVAGIALLVGVGCSADKKPTAASGAPQGDELREVGGMISLYSGKFNRGPAKASDLAPYENGFPLGYAAVRDGNVVVLWGATVAGEGDAAKGGGDIVAYEKKVPTDGGFVLLQSGHVKEMNAAEFGSAPKAAAKK